MKKILAIILTLFLPVITHAATFAIEVDTGRETVNALEGTLILPKEASVENVYTGHSVISIWITSPKVESGVIRFAGITPGGFRGKYELFSIETASVDGLYFGGMEAYKGDGSGQRVSVKLSLRETEVAEDTAPPESFKPLISNSPDLFDGRHFISFATQDKGTGLDRYEVDSSWLFGQRDWITTESPRVLSYSELFKKIHIRAIDKAGNAREVSTAGPFRYPALLIGTIILLCVLLLLRRSPYLRYLSLYLRL